MKIYFVANQGQIGGGEVMLLALAQAARELGHTPYVVAPAQPDEVIRTATERGFPCRPLAGGNRVTYGVWLLRWAIRTDGLIWANGLFPALATTPHRRVVHLHQVPRSRVQRLAVTVARVGARAVVAPSHFVARHIPGARALPNWCPQVDVSARTTGAPGRLRLGFAGRLSREKGIETLANAVAQLRSRGVDAELVVAGESRFVTPQEADAVRTCLDALDSHVTYLGWVEPAEYLRQVDVAVVPSHVPEAFGLVAAEAMSARVPLVVTDAGALPEIVGDSYPYVVPADSAAALADAVVAAFQGPSKVVERAFDRWQTTYSPSAGRTRLAELLEAFTV